LLKVNRSDEFLWRRFFLFWSTTRSEGVISTFIFGPLEDDVVVYYSKRMLWLWMIIKEYHLLRSTSRLYQEGSSCFHRKSRSWWRDGRNDKKRPTKIQWLPTEGQGVNRTRNFPRLQEMYSSSWISYMLIKYKYNVC
jgi:hypothetical protein